MHHIGFLKVHCAVVCFAWESDLFLSIAKIFVTMQDRSTAIGHYSWHRLQVGRGPDMGGL